MDFSKLKCISDNVNLDDYLKLYKYVRDNMEYPEWLGTFEKEEIEDILNNGGKIWLYYDHDKLVCSMFYIPVKNKTLIKHNIIYDSEDTASLGPIMVSKDYIGNHFQYQMMKVFDDYCISMGKKYIFTKVHSDNIYSINNMLDDGYILVDEYENERGMNKVFIKEIK